MADRDYVLTRVCLHWTDILLLKQITGTEVLSEVQFTTARFWVKAYDVSGKKQTISFARLLASNIGKCSSVSKLALISKWVIEKYE